MKFHACMTRCEHISSSSVCVLQECVAWRAHQVGNVVSMKVISAFMMQVR